ncbi:S41 family peptidase [Rheinheimera metallidurans]|uniref:S41 family peptidase n=1 Tax=Rheinheimera metallidurans TaxID=2925781 RepID=UPI0030020001
MRKIILLAVSVLLNACGGGGDITAPTQLCQRTDTNAKIFCALQKDYLWYQALPTTIEPANYATPQALLDAVAEPQDRFSFVLTEQEYEDRYINATYFGYGFATVRADNNGALQLIYVFDDGSAAQNGLRRGDKIVEIEGRSVASWLSQLDAGKITNDDIYGPNVAGVVRNFVWKKPDNSTLSADLIKRDVATNTVLHTSVVVQGNKRVGYLVFNSFIELSEFELEQAFAYFVQQNINELVLDLRYNGGGLIRVANQLSTQIARNAVQGQTFVKYQYNDQNSGKNNTSLFSLGAGRSALNLNRVFTLTTGSTCSASELVINSLAPFIDVVQIGEPTCGKPVGMQPDLINNYVLFAINFQTVNALGQGDYFSGLTPECAVASATTGDWGTANDPLYATALAYIAGNGCNQQAVATSMNRMLAIKPRSTAPWQVNNEQ